VSEDGKHPSGSSESPEEAPQDSLRGSVELPRVILGSDDGDRAAPRKRVLPGLVDVRWLVYPAYITCFIAGGLAVDFAIEGGEWSAAPVALAWLMLFFWEWIYGVAYRYRRTILKYFSFLLVAGLSAGLAALCWERAEPQLVATAAELVDRDHASILDYAAITTLLSGAFVTIHVVVAGRGYREKKVHGKP
jgi:hypothetical protein